MSKITKLIICTFLTLSGCATQSTMFGMSEAQFHQLTPSQQNQVIASYNRQQEQERENAQIGHALNTLEYLGKLNSNNH